MSENFFEIQNGNFTASEQNKVNNVNLVIKNQGEIVSLLGPSGIGKTTILRTIAGLQKLSEGKIKLRGKTLTSDQIHIEPEKRNVALSFQDNSLFPNYKVIDNINFGEKRTNGHGSSVNVKEIIELLNTVELSGLIYAEINFDAKWNIESGYDYVQLEISTNNGDSWIPQCGKYSGGYPWRDTARQASQASQYSVNYMPRRIRKLPSLHFVS